jgi:hypothetical protein
MSRQRWSGTAAAFSLVLLVVSVGLNTLQARRIRDLVDRKAESPSRIGQKAPHLTGLTLDGRPRVLRFDEGQPTVLYFFSPTCRWCEENWSNVRALSAEQSGRFRFVAVAAETALIDFARSRNLDFEIVGGVSSTTLKALGFGATPHTLVVSSLGLISQEWVGAFQGRKQRSIESFFEVKLPGLSRSQDPR